MDCEEVKDDNVQKTQVKNIILIYQMGILT